MLSGLESEEQNNLAEEYEEEVFEQDDYEDDEELEYIEIKKSSEEINKTKKLYMDNDYPSQNDNQNSFNQIDAKKKIDLKQKQKSSTNLTSKRPIQNATETLDIEPVNEKNFVKDNKKSENFEIDDPW